MQSCWEKLAEIHASLTGATVLTISPESWHRIISQTLSASPGSDDIKCHVSPGLCQHCHQMLALSAVATMTLLAKTKRDGQMEEVYLEPLLHHDLLTCMVDLLQHPCQYLRYQSRKALTSVCSLPALTPSSAQRVAALCVQSVLRGCRGGGATCLEPLQLLCGLLSARSGCRHRGPLSASLLPSLPTLYQHCCQSPCSLPTDLNSGATSARVLAQPARECSRGTGAVQGVRMQTCSTSVPKTKRPFCDGSGDPPSKQTRTGLFTQQGTSQPASSILLGDETVKANCAKELGCEMKSEGNQHSDLNSAPSNKCGEAAEQIPEERKVCGHTEQKAFSQNCSNLHFESDHFADENIQPEQHADITHCELENDDKNASVHMSNQTLMSHYVFLCLIQKLTKLCNSLEASERGKQARALKSTVLTQLITDHAALFRRTRARQSSGGLLVERKFLDALDTFLDYGQLRTSPDVDRVHAETAGHFVRRMLAAHCSWTFPHQSTLIGGRLSQSKGRGDLPGADLWHASENGGEEELLGGKGHADCSPVLVLLLAVVLKSCAIILKSEKDQTGISEDVTACVTLLLSVNSHLRQVFGAGHGAEDGTGGSATCVNWLAWVCGEQDDRWTEALLCLLDIFMCLQPLTAPGGGDDVRTLMTALGPHPLFLQLLETTRYNSSLLIDWLTSPETCFLAYLTRYLRLTAHDFPAFVLALSPFTPEDRQYASPGKEPLAADTALCGSGRRGVTTELTSFGLHVGAQHTVSVEQHTADIEQHMVIVEQHTADIEQHTADIEQHMVIVERHTADIERHTADIERPRSSADGDPTGCDNGSSPHTLHDPSSDSADQSAGATGVVDKVRESSVGMALLSCYDADSSSSSSSGGGGGDSAADESCEEGSLAVAAPAAESSGERAAPFERQEKEDAVYFPGKRRSTGDEGEAKPDRSASSDSLCSDVDDSDNDESNDTHFSIAGDNDETDDEMSGDSSLSRTDSEERTRGTSQREQPNPLCPTRRSRANTKFVEGRETTEGDHHVGRVDRVMHLLTEVRVRLERLHRGGLLVYNPAPLLSLLRTTEQQYYNSRHSV